MRRRRPVRTIEFTPASTHEVIDWMAHLSAAKDGWINLLPGVPEGLVEEPGEGVFGALFGTADAPVAMATWLPVSNKTPEQTVGIAHGLRKKARVRLAEIGVDVPSSWRRSQDNSRRGLIAHPNANEPHELVLGWIVKATTALTSLPLTGTWQAKIYLPYGEKGD